MKTYEMQIPFDSIVISEQDGRILVEFRHGEHLMTTQLTGHLPNFSGGDTLTLAGFEGFIKGSFT